MYFFYNNKFYLHRTAVIPTDSKAFRYGELVFETMRLRNGVIMFFEQHVARLQEAAHILHINFPKLFTAPILKRHILATVQKNNLDNARVRVTVFKGNGGLFETDENAFNVLVETYTIATPDYEWNTNGLVLCTYTEMKKPINIVSKYKTGNHLLYNLAAHFAKQQHCNEAVVLNTNNTVADTTISTIFLIKNNQLITPPLSDGGVAGIMRNHLIGIFDNVIEKSINLQDITEADGVFVSNAIKGIQWVQTIDDTKYLSQLVEPYFIKFHQSLS